MGYESSSAKAKGFARNFHPSRIKSSFAPPVTPPIHHKTVSECIKFRILRLPSPKDLLHLPRRRRDDPKSSKAETITNASVAQLVEQLTLNQLVLGSNPSRGISKKLSKAHSLWGFFILFESADSAQRPPKYVQIRVNSAKLATGLDILTIVSGDKTPPPRNTFHDFVNKGKIIPFNLESAVGHRIRSAIESCGGLNWVK